MEQAYLDCDSRSGRPDRRHGSRQNEAECGSLFVAAVRAGRALLACKHDSASAEQTPGKGGQGADRRAATRPA